MEQHLTTDNKHSNEWLSFIYVIILALMIRIFLIELFYVPTGSMKLTVLEGDYLFSTKYSYGYSKHSFPFSPPIFDGRVLITKPDRGDIVIFRPPHKMDIRYVKRLIGLPGDKIQLINDVVYINDKPIKRQEVGSNTDENGQIYLKFKETLPNGVSYYSYKLAHDENDDNWSNRFGNTDVFYVPEDKYFFLGDNRDQSRDSRVDLGYVPFENFIAKVQFIFVSTKEPLWLEGGSFTQVITRFWTWASSVRFDRVFKNIYSLN